MALMLLLGCTTKPPYVPPGGGIAGSSDYVFDITSLPEITITVPLEEWNLLLSNYDINHDNEEKVVAHFAFKKNGKVDEIANVGLRLRGNTSRKRPEGYEGQPHNPINPDWRHAHFSVKFDEYVSKRTFYSIDHLILKWFKDDGMYCREIYCYDLFKRFGVWTAPRASYAKLTINIEGGAEPAYFGVYAMIEGVNDSYLDYRKEQGKWASSKGNLWKAKFSQTDLSNMDDWRMGISNVTLDPAETVEYVYDLKTNKKTGLDAAKSELKDFINNMNPLKSGSVALKSYLEEHMDVDLFLRAYAVNVMVGMWDDYWMSANNYYFYFDTNGKFYFIPFDYDNTLGTSLYVNAGTHDMLNWGPRDGTRVLMRKVLSIQEYEDRFKEYIKELADANNDLFYTTKSIARIQSWHAMIEPYIANDTGQDMNLVDVPGSWGNCEFYRILSGNDEGGENGDANFFKTKIKSIYW